MSSKVFVVQRQLRRDPTNGDLVPLYDLTPAEEFGELVYVLPPDASPHRPSQVLPLIRSCLSNMTPKDYLLLIGNPCLIGWSTAVAARATGGQLTLLQWHNRSRCYIPVEAKVFDEE